MKTKWTEVPMADPCAQIRIQTDTDQTVHVSLHSHTYYEILLSKSGSIQYLLGDKRFRIKQGDILLIPPGVSHQPLFREPLKEPYSRYVIWINDVYWKQQCEEFPDLNFAFEQCRKRGSYLLRSTRATWAGLFSAASLAFKEAREQKLGWAYCSRTLLISLMAHISRTYYYQDLQLPPAEKSVLADDIFFFIDEHLSETLTLERVARHFLVSPSTISHTFQKNMQVSFHQCVIQRRLVAAKNGILSGIPLKIIWERCGFPDYSAFYRSFKKEYGISPGEFKRFHRLSPPDPGPFKDIL